MAASILKDQQTQLTLANFLPDAKLKFIFDEAALEDLIAFKELLQQGALLNKQETSYATAQNAVDMLVALGVEEDNFVVPETEADYRAKCAWAAIFGLQPVADWNQDLLGEWDYNADLNQDIQPPDLGFDLPMANTSGASFEEENTIRSGDDMMLGSEDFTEGGAAFSADTWWSGAQGGSSSMTLSEIPSLQIGENEGPSAEEGPTSERGHNASEEAGGGEPGVGGESSTIVEESSSGSIAMVTSRQDTSTDSVASVSSKIGKAFNTSTVLNPNSSSTETICGRLTTCGVINNNNDNNSGYSVLHYQTREGMGSFSPSLDADASPPISDQSLSRSKEAALKNMATDASSSDVINSTRESLVKRASVDVVKQISASGFSSSNDEEDDVSEVSSSVSADSGFDSPKRGKSSADSDSNSPESGKRSADSDNDSPKSKRRVSFSEENYVQKFVGGSEGDSRCTWHGFVGGVSIVKAKKESLEVRSKMQEKGVVAEKSVAEEKGVVTEKRGVVEEVEERVLVVNTTKEGAIFRGIVQEDEVVEVGSDKSVEEVDRIPLRSPKEAATVAVFPSVKRELEVEKGPSCKVCVASKKPRLGRCSTDVGMAAHSRKHSRQVRLQKFFSLFPPHLSCMQGWKSGCQVAGCRGKNYRRHMEPRELVRHARMEHTREEPFRLVGWLYDCK